MTKPADAPGSPMDWFNKNAEKLSPKYSGEWVVISGKGVELHGGEFEKVSDELDKKPKEQTKNWIAHFVP